MSAPRRAALLRAMGLSPIWRRRAALANGTPAPVALPEERPVTPLAAGAALQSGAAAMPPQQRRAAPRTASPLLASATQPPLLRAPAEAPTDAPVAARADAPAASHGDEQRPAHIATLSWDALEDDIRACRACALCEQRTQAVPGVGDRGARWLLVGEAPGREEDRRGEPFVGPAGQLLDNMLAAIGLRRDADVYIANAIKCRPPHNRTPQADEVARCLPYLHRQIELLQPRLIVALGRPAALALLGTEISISAARGRVFRPLADGPPVLVSYHPAYLLRNPQDKAKAWEDLCFAVRTMNELSGS